MRPTRDLHAAHAAQNLHNPYTGYTTPAQPTYTHTYTTYTHPTPTRCAPLLRGGQRRVTGTERTNFHMIEVPDTPPRRRDREVCSACEASPQACRSNEWLRGRRCCDACDGDHDQTARTTA